MLASLDSLYRLLGSPRGSWLGPRMRLTLSGYGLLLIEVEWCVGAQGVIRMIGFGYLLPTLPFENANYSPQAYPRDDQIPSPPSSPLFSIL